MLKEKREHINFKVPTRPGYPELGISKERLCELQNGCRVGLYSSETLKEACRGLEFIEPWIILSVTKSKSYDLIEFNSELGRVPVGRSNFYALRRKFYYNLDAILREVLK